MIAPVGTLSPRERAAVVRLLEPAVAPSKPALLAAILFGSKARGDFDLDSDVDLLLICGAGEDRAEAFGRRLALHAAELEDDTGIAIEPWAISVDCLARGRRTPMLIDALEDGVPLWPRDQPPLRLPFTPADACFCAECLLQWAAEGGAIVRAALRDDRLADAAGRARDDITRLATAGLLLAGSTRHRRAGSLDRFERRFVRTGRISRAVLPALRWARSAFPVDGGRGRDRAPVPPGAAVRARVGYRLAGTMAAEVVPWMLRRIATLERRAGLSGCAATPPSTPPR